MQHLFSILAKADLIFWDFDGVIKESVEVKSAAFEQLFMQYGQDVAGRVREHHEANGGISRFDKIPHYLRLAGESDSAENIERFCGYFSCQVKQAVIDSPWVPGVHSYLESQFRQKVFVLVSATPEEEIRDILSSLQIVHCFQEVYGAPTEKSRAIFQVLQKRPGASLETSLMIGDSMSDFRAAEKNNIPFLLRQTPLNTSLQEACSCLMFENFSL